MSSDDTPTMGFGPIRVAMVSPERAPTSCSRTARSEMPVRSIKRPVGSTIALNPVGAACSTQRSFSMARSRLEATCWD